MRLSVFTESERRRRGYERVTAANPNETMVIGGACVGGDLEAWHRFLDSCVIGYLDDFERQLPDIEARAERARAFAADCEYQQQCRESDRAAFQAHQDELLARRIGVSPSAITVRARIR